MATGDIITAVAVAEGSANSFVGVMQQALALIGTIETSREEAVLFLGLLQNDPSLPQNAKDDAQAWAVEMRDAIIAAAQAA